MQNSQENTCVRVSPLIKLQVSACKFIKKETLASACNFNKKVTLAPVFSCEFCEISKNTFFTEHLWVTPSEASGELFRSEFLVKYCLENTYGLQVFSEVKSRIYFVLTHYWPVFPDIQKLVNCFLYDGGHWSLMG